MDSYPDPSPAVQAAAWRSQQNFLLAAAFIMPLTFSVWQALLNNFVIERAAFTGAEIGILQSLREIPGFLAFSAVFVLLVMREQRFALASRRRYWLYYALTFLSGARRQIFMVFAGFMMVEKFGYSAADISLLYLANYVFNLFFAARIGSWVGRTGERTALRLEYIGLIAVFTSYAFVEHAGFAAFVYFQLMCHLTLLPRVRWSRRLRLGGSDLYRD